MIIKIYIFVIIKIFDIKNMIKIFAIQYKEFLTQKRKKQIFLKTI